MQNQYLITKDENGNYVIASPSQSSDSKSYTLEKLCTLACAGNDPCKNCDKCNKPTPVAVPPVQVDPATLLAYLKSQRSQPKNIKFVDTKGGLSRVSVVLISLGVLLLLISAFYLYKFLYKKFKKFNKLLSKKDLTFNENDPSTYHNYDAYNQRESRNFLGLPDKSDNNWSSIDTTDV